MYYQVRFRSANRSLRLETRRVVPQEEVCTRRLRQTDLSEKAIKTNFRQHGLSKVTEMKAA